MLHATPRPRRAATSSSPTRFFPYQLEHLLQTPPIDRGKRASHKHSRPVEQFEPERQRIGAAEMRHFIDERFAREDA